MKKYLIIFLFFIINLSSFGAIINGGVEYDYEYIQEENLNTPQLSESKIISNLTDTNRDENITALKAGIKQVKNRIGDIFSDGSYGIMYLDNPLYSWFYSPEGKLISYSVKSSAQYPTKIVKYKPDGKIINITIKLSKKESYIYALDGSLIARWQGNTCYDSNNNIIMTRKEIDSF